MINVSQFLFWVQKKVLGPVLDLDRGWDVNSFPCIVTLVILGVLSVAILFISPVMIGAMVELLGFHESQAAYVISIELAGMCLATFPALYWSSRINWRVALLVALTLLIIGNLLSATTSDYESLLILRLLTGFAAGSSMAICVAMLGLTRDPDRNFGLWVTGQLVFGAIGLWLLPRVLPTFGFGFIYLVIAVLTVGLLFLLRNLPQRRNSANWIDQTDEGDPPAPAPIWSYAGLLAIFVFYLGQYGIWAYLERIGAHSGLSTEGIGLTLSVATIMGIVGALGAAALNARLGRILPISLATLISLLSMFLLLGGFDTTRFLVAASVFSITFNFILPYLMACIASVDKTGRFIILTTIASGAGLAGGPVIATLVQRPPGYDEVVWVGIFLTFSSLALVARLAVLSSESVEPAPAVVPQIDSPVDQFR